MPDARKTLRNAADEVPLPKSRSSGARRAKAMCAVQAFGLLEYSSLPARSVLRDESRGERSGRGSASQKQVLRCKACKGDVRGAGLWPTGVHWPLQNAASEVPSS